jgi:hypothetical protein
MPGYWFMYNMYALARNSWKYTDRDKRADKKQFIETDFLAPDTINEIIFSLELFQNLVGEAWLKKNPDTTVSNSGIIGKRLLEKNDAALAELDIIVSGFENTNRTVRLVKVPAAYHIFKKLVNYYAATLLTNFITANKINSFDELLNELPSRAPLAEWENAGGQLIRKAELEKMQKQIVSGKIKSWDDIHDFYIRQAENYASEKLAHALAAVKKVSGFAPDKTYPVLKNLLEESIITKKWMVDNIYNSREKDYSNPFRLMVYENAEEMDKVVGSLEDNPFILQEKQAFNNYKKAVTKVIKTMGF